jgi:hypothetical protein
MIAHFMAPDTPYPGDILNPGFDGDGAGLLPDVDDGTGIAPDGGQDSGPTDALEPGGTADRDHVVDAIWRWLGVEVVDGHGEWPTFGGGTGAGF